MQTAHAKEGACMIVEDAPGDEVGGAEGFSLSRANCVPFPRASAAFCGDLQAACPGYPRGGATSETSTQ